MDCLINFYETLYKSKSISDDAIETYLKNIKCEKTTENDKREYDELPTMRECETAIKCMKNIKSPGQVDLRQNFIKCFGMI